MNSKVNQVILPVAGLGTRFLPVTKSVPKELIPVVDKPIIHYAIEEAFNAGISDFILVNHPDKDAIENYFTHDERLESSLKEKNKLHLLESVLSLRENQISFRTAYQHEPLGLGHAVLCARESIDSAFIAVILPDDLIISGGKSCLQQMLDIHQQFDCGVIAVENVPREQTNRYGIVEIKTGEAGSSRITSIIEKPEPEAAPSTLAVVGRYILPATIFDLLSRTATGAGGEIQLTDAIAALLQQEPVMACEFNGTRYDCGSRLGYLQANVALGLENEEFGEEFTEYLKQILAPRDGLEPPT